MHIRKRQTENRLALGLRAIHAFRHYGFSVLPVLAVLALVGEYYRVAYCAIALAVAQAFYILLDRQRDPSGALDAIDCGVLLAAAYEIPSLAMSPYQPNSIYWSASLLFAALVYFLLRTSLRSVGQVIAVSSSSAAFGVWLSVPALSRFGTQLDALRAAGFVGIVPFREKLTMESGYIGGEWFTVVLLTAPYALLLVAFAFSRRRRALVSVTCAVNSIAS